MPERTEWVGSHITLRIHEEGPAGVDVAFGGNIDTAENWGDGMFRMSGALSGGDRLVLVTNHSGLRRPEEPNTNGSVPVDRRRLSVHAALIAAAPLGDALGRVALTAHLERTRRVPRRGCPRHAASILAVGCEGSLSAMYSPARDVRICQPF